MLFNNISLGAAISIYAFGLMVFAIGVAILMAQAGKPVSDHRAFGITFATVGFVFMIMPTAPLTEVLVDLALRWLWSLAFC